MRASRLISMVLLLQVRGAMTARELARELEVSERTIVRDVEALSEAGIAVYAERGRAGGYRLLDGYRTRLTGLTRAEAEALFVSGLPGPVRQMGLATAVAAARHKVLAALPPGLRDASAVAAQRFHLDAPRWFRSPEPPDLLAPLATATWTDRVLTATYCRDDQPRVRRLEPYGLVLKSGVWYAVARVDTHLRIYRVDRFSRITLTDERFHRDPDFDLSSFWDERSADFVRSILATRIRIRLSPTGGRRLLHAVEHPSAVEALQSTPPVAAEPDSEGWVALTLPVESLDIAYGQLLGLGPEVEVLEPPELRARLAASAERLSLLYRQPRNAFPVSASPRSRSSADR